MKLLSLLALTAFATPAFAGADLQVTITEPANVSVDERARWEVEVANVGNRTAKNYRLVIDLPETNTSPTVHILGDVTWQSNNCYVDGTQISCLLGRIRKNRSKTKAFDIALPYSSEPLTLTAYITSPDDNPANDVDSVDATLNPYVVAVGAPQTYDHFHCTGQDLTSFYECELFPSSITSHETTFEVGGTISFPYQGGYTGTWSQPTTDTLVFDYSNASGVVAQFEGVGVDGGCFEGLVTFPTSSSVSPYQVCPQ